MSSDWKTNLKNKVLYNFHKAVYDPDANKFAEEQKMNQETNNTDIQNTSAQNEKSQDDSTEHNTGNISAKRIATLTGNKIKSYLSIFIYPFITLMIAMLVANDMIVYSAPIRIVTFIVICITCWFNVLILPSLTIYYIGKAGYAYYKNNLSELKVRHYIMPTIFAMLPITTTQPESALFRGLMYPFTYPKTQGDADTLELIMKQYFSSLENSFNNFNKYKAQPVFTEVIQKVKTTLDSMHTTNTN